MTVFELAALIPMGTKIVVKKGPDVYVGKAKDVCEKYIKYINEVQQIEEVIPEGCTDANGISYMTIILEDER